MEQRKELREYKHFPARYEKEADVVVVGFGAAGAAAAIEAHEKGATVLILEKMRRPGGNTVMSGGVVYGANTIVQKSAGVEDSGEQCLRYLHAVADGLADNSLMRLWAEKSGENIRWLSDLGVKFPRERLRMDGYEQFPEYAAITPPRPRSHYPERGGRGLMNPLIKAVSDRSIEVMFEMPVRGLVTAGEKGEVLGVNCDKLNIKARKAVVLATGGFAQSVEMFNRYQRPYANCPAYGAWGIDGDGIKVAHALGADLVNMGLMGPILSTVPYGSITVSPTKKLTKLFTPWITHLKWAPCILVDTSGVRFTDEYIFYLALSEKIIRLKDRTCFCIFDENAKSRWESKIKTGEGLIPQIEKGIIKRAPTIRVLAQKISVSPDILQDTVSRFNKNVEKGIDPEFKRNRHLVPVETPSFYAMQYKLVRVATIGGLRINTKAQVLDVNGSVVPRLYAAGETVGGFVGRRYPGTGYFLSYCFVSGRVAGESASQEMSLDA
jgi:urocanate reductase